MKWASPEARRAYYRAHYQKHRARKLAAAKEQRERLGKAGVRQRNRAQRVRAYGLTVLQYQALHAEQGGVCAICTKPNVLGRELAVDHDHRTGRVRGLLCNSCNVALGHLREDPALFARALAYLQQGATACPPQRA